MSKRVAAFGEVMMRLAVPGYELLRQAASLHFSFSGTGVNFLGALAAYGHRGYLVSSVPDNPIGDAALAHLGKLGIAVDYVRRQGSHLGMYFLETGFGPRPGRVTYAGRADSSFNTAPPGSYDWPDMAERLRMVHFCGITLAMNDTVRGHALDFALCVQKRAGTVVFDCNYRPSLWGDDGYDKARPHYGAMLALADVVFMNERDALGVLGLKTDASYQKDQLTDVIPRVAATYRTRVIAGTQRTVHDNGLHTLRGYMYRDGQFVFSPEFTFPVHDRIGAGDAFSGGIVHGLLSGWAADETVTFATAAAMLAHTTTGDTPLLKEGDVLSALHDNGADVRR